MSTFTSYLVLLINDLCIWKIPTLKYLSYIQCDKSINPKSINPTVRLDYSAELF